MKSRSGDSGTRKGTVWITLGLLLVAAALVLATYNLYDDIRADRSVRQIIDWFEEHLLSGNAAGTGGEQASSMQGGQKTPDYILFPDMEMPVETINGTDFVGVLSIPSLDLKLPVISQWSYPNLKTAPCRYSGSAYSDDLIICGHNYSSHFGSLKNLNEGDIATFTDVSGNVFTYKVVQREVLNPTAVEEMESGDWDLTLFTCTVGGRTRVTVRFERVGLT